MNDNVSIQYLLVLSFIVTTQDYSDELVLVISLVPVATGADTPHSNVWYLVFNDRSC